MAYLLYMNSHRSPSCNAYKAFAKDHNFGEPRPRWAKGAWILAPSAATFCDEQWMEVMTGHESSYVLVDARYEVNLKEALNKVGRSGRAKPKFSKDWRFVVFRDSSGVVANVSAQVGPWQV